MADWNLMVSICPHKKLIQNGRFITRFGIKIVDKLIESIGWITV